MKKIILIFLLLITNYSLLIAQSGWFIQQNTFPGIPQNLFFIDSNTGWIMLDSGRIIRTTNGGANWSPMYYLQSPYPISTIKFLNPLTGWAVGGGYYYNPFSFEYSIIMKTTNGGINWVTQFSDSWGPRFNDVAIADSNFVFATSSGTDQSGMASYGILKKTSNGGQNWSNDPYSGMAMKSVYFTNSQTGWVCGYTQMDVPPTRRFIYKTTNRGVNWTLVFRDSVMAFSPIITRIYFPNVNTGYKILGGALKKSVNGGVNWTALDSSNTFNLSDLFFVSSDTGWIIKNNIRRTNNGGVNWTIQNTPAPAGKIFFVNAYTGWALGSVLMKTTNGGLTFIERTSNIIPGKYALYQNYPNPFNPVTKIKFDIAMDDPKGTPRFRGNDRVVLKVYDLLGKEIQTLVSEKLQPGTYEVEWNASQFPSGIYFYQLRSDNFIETKKLILLK